MSRREAYAARLRHGGPDALPADLPAARAVAARRYAEVEVAVARAAETRGARQAGALEDAALARTAFRAACDHAAALVLGGEATPP